MLDNLGKIYAAFYLIGRLETAFTCIMALGLERMQGHIFGIPIKALLRG